MDGPQQPASCRFCKQKDFTLLEMGSLSAFSSSEQHCPQRRKQIIAPLQLPAHQFTYFRNQDPGGVMNIVLFDTLNTPILDQAYARYQLLKFLRSIPHGNPVALFILGSRLRMVQGFTDDPEKLLHAANQMHPGLSSQMAAPSNRTCKTRRTQELRRRAKRHPLCPSVG